MAVRVELKEVVTLGKVSKDAVDAVVDSVLSAVDPLSDITVIEGGREVKLQYWLEGDTLVAVNASEDGKTLYALVVDRFNDLLLLVFDIFSAE